jgi:dTDP-4-dehydrorhamnose reductase
VFDGTKKTPYVETDATNPGGVYGESKLGGEAAIARATGDFVILRTSWVYSAEGTNFVRTMLRLASEREEIAVVDDQVGSPTYAADLAAGIVTIGEKVLSAADRRTLTGLYHLTGSGATSWCGFARAIMARSAAKGGPSCRVRAITTAEYPTRARRPANSRLDCGKAERTFGVRLPDWQDGLARCLDQLVPAAQGTPT